MRRVRGRTSSGKGRGVEHRGNLTEGLVEVCCGIELGGGYALQCALDQDERGGREDDVRGRWGAKRGLDRLVAVLEAYQVEVRDSGAIWRLKAKVLSKSRAHRAGR